MKEKIRVINHTQITAAVTGPCIDANTCIGDDIHCALKSARERETSLLAQSALDVLLENIQIAEREKMPICQDTGIAVVFVDIGEGIYIDGNIEKAINEGVAQGYSEGYCRSSVIRDPIDRVNTKDNTPAVIHYDFTGDEAMRGKLRITVAPKGFGSENMSAVKMLTPSDGLQGVEDFIVETVKKAGSNPCPPVIVGVGIGGTMEKAALLSKKALLREVGTANADPKWSQVETRLQERINALGIGVSGYGGDTTALGIHILTYPTHIAGLPVAVNIGCHATRHRMTLI